MSDAVVTVTLTEFKTKCFDLVEGLEEGKLDKIVVTRNGVHAGESGAVGKESPSIFGAHPDSVTFVEGVDLTEPTFSNEEFDAYVGRLHR